MAQYFEVTATYEKTLENGAIGRVSEKFLVDALSVSEAEAVIAREVQTGNSGEFFTTVVKKTKISEVFGDAQSERFYLVKVGFVTLDERTAKEKRTVSQIIVGADSFKEAYDIFSHEMRGTMADYEIISIAETPIVEVYPAKV